MRGVSRPIPGGVGGLAGGSPGPCLGGRLGGSGQGVSRPRPRGSRPTWGVYPSMH